MKKITIIASLLAFSGAFAQTFPTPYCEMVDDYEGIEEITYVNFGGTELTNTDDTSILLDFTSTTIDVIKDQSYTVEVSGNSDGDEEDAYENSYVLFVDWNQNGVLNDPGEALYMGKIVGSTGYDDKFASINVTVPNDAVVGNTRARITKTYVDEAWEWMLNTDPCHISIDDTFEGEIIGSYGQAIDFTLNVGTLGVNENSKKLFVAYPNPTKGELNLNTSANIEEVSIYNLQGQLVLNVKNRDKVDVSQLPTGQYLIKANANGLSQTSKFVKQ